MSDSSHNGLMYMSGVMGGLFFGMLIRSIFATDPQADLGPILRLMCENPAFRQRMATLPVTLGEGQIIKVDGIEVTGGDGSSLMVKSEGATGPIRIESQIAASSKGADYTIEPGKNASGEGEAVVGRSCEVKK